MTRGECYDAADRLLKLREALAALRESHKDALDDIENAHRECGVHLDALSDEITAAENFYIWNSSAPREREREID